MCQVKMHSSTLRVSMHYCMFTIYTHTGFWFSRGFSENTSAFPSLFGVFPGNFPCRARLFVPTSKSQQSVQQILNIPQWQPLFKAQSRVIFTRRKPEPKTGFATTVSIATSNPDFQNVTSVTSCYLAKAKMAT